MPRSGAQGGGAIKAPPPNPDRYCPVHHGGILFPQALPKAQDPFALYAIVRKNLCRAVGHAGVGCSPDSCAATIAPMADRPTGMFVNACKQQWRQYYDTQEAIPEGAIESLLDEDLLW